MAVRRPLVASNGQAVELPLADTLSPSALGYSSGSNANGTWWRHGEGTIEQFGTVTLVNGVATVTFPLAFPNACLHCDPVPVVAGMAASTSINAWLASAPTKTQAVINGRSLTTLLGVLNLGVGAFDVKWHAIGN